MFFLCLRIIEYEKCLFLHLLCLGGVWNVLSNGVSNMGCSTWFLGSPSPFVTLIEALSALSASILGGSLTYDDDAYATGVTASTGAPTLVTHGVPLDDDKIDLVVEAVFNNTDGASNADVYVWIYSLKGIWFVVAGGAVIDLQLQTGDMWQCRVANAKSFGDRYFVEIRNMVTGAAGGNIDVEARQVRS